MSSEGIVTSHIGFVVSVNISILGVGTLVSAPSIGVLKSLFWVPDTTMSEHSPVTTLGIITGHFDLSVTIEVSESGPGTSMGAPSVDVGRVDGSSEGSIAIGHSVPMSSEGIRADLVGSSISIKIGVVNISTFMSAPSGTEFVGSGVGLGDEVVVEFFLFFEFSSVGNSCHEGEL